ncbi:asparagine--tRNA ligase [bacterium]|nr:asparagine--tRNA ligase [bacterium]
MLRIIHVKDFIGEEVEIKGWLYNKRSKGKILFLIVRDGSGYIQVVGVKGESPDYIFDIYDELGLESSVIVKGIVRKEPRSIGGYELSLTGLEPVQIAVDYPIQKKEHGTAFLMEHRHLWIRSKKQRAILRIRNEVEKAIVDFFYENDFVRIDTPILTPTAAEGSTTLFSTEYFDMGKAYLAQTGQLYLEAAIFANGLVYNFGPTFRAEKSKTRRHLTEFWMVEAEEAYYDNDDNMKVQENFISYIIERVIKRCADELKILERDTNILQSISLPFPKITYDDAVELLQKDGFSTKWGEDFGGDEETAISKHFDKPVFIMDYPRKIKAFYMKEHSERPELVRCADLIAPEGYGEIIGGSQREDDYDKLLARMEEFGLAIENYRWYLDLRKYGSVVHSGFGLGIERTVAWICGIPHVREATAFPRMLYRIYP